MGFGSVLWKKLFSYSFQYHNLQGNDQNFKKDGYVRKREDHISRESRFFLFLQSKLMSYFFRVIPIFPGVTLKGKS